MATYSRRVSLRDSFIKVLSRRLTTSRRPNRLKGSYLFRAAARLILEYIDWLTEEPIAEEIGDDVAVNIRMTEEKKVEKKALVLQDRSILLIRPEERSRDDSKYIYELFKKFHIFRKYPERVRETLAGLIRYQYLESDRVIVRQGRPAENVYFIISGEVGVSKVVIDHWTGEPETVDMGILSYGDIFGEIALLHKIPRSATVVSRTVVELILISLQDFDEMLRSHLQNEWDILQDAAVHFNYFKSWSAETIRECCILSRLQAFQPDEVLLGDGKGMVNYVHFLVDGECRLIEHMNIRERRTPSGMHYELYDSSKTDTEMKVRGPCKSHETAEIMDELQYKFAATRENSLDEVDDNESSDYGDLLLSSKQADRKIDLERASIITTTLLDTMTQWHKITDVAEILMREPSSTSQQCYPSDVRTIFIQVCTFYRGACFGLGENMLNRRIIANTSVKCFLVPRYWLMTHNRANIWERVKLFMDSKFPTRKQLFKEFVRNRRWMEYKKTLFNNVGKRGRCIRSNVTMHDVPYAIRIVNKIDVEE